MKFPRTLSSALRVAIVSPTFGGYGGLEAFSLAIIAGLPPSEDLDVRLFFKQAPGCRIVETLLDAAAPYAERVRFIPRGGRELFEAVRWADVVQSQNPSPDTVLVSRLLRRPVLVTVINHRQRARSLHARLWRGCLKAADQRFYTSDFVRRTWEGDRMSEGSHLVYPMCELAHGMLPIESRRGFVFAARWIENKGIEPLLQAYAIAKLDPERWPLTLIGDGPLRDRVQSLIRELRLRGVSTPGFVSEETKANLIRGARWMVIPPNTREDFGLTAIEARHLGVPCIITRDGGLPEAAGEDALSCEPADIEGLCACLKQAAAMPEAEYTERANRTRVNLLPKLTTPARFASAYRELACRSMTAVAAA